MLFGLTALKPVADADAASKQRVSRAAKVTLQQLDNPYRYNSAGPQTFDCSKLMHYSFRKTKIKIPRTSSTQARHTHRIPKRKLRRGDLMFFTNNGGVYHAAMFLKRNKRGVVMVHSPGSGQRMKRAHPWTSRWFNATLRR